MDGLSIYALIFKAKNENVRKKNIKISKFQKFESKFQILWDIFQYAVYKFMLTPSVTLALQNLQTD